MYNAESLLIFSFHLPVKTLVYMSEIAFTNTSASSLESNSFHSHLFEKN